MKNIKVEIKWALIFSTVGILWMLLEKLCGLHGKYIDYHMYLTNLFAVPAIAMMTWALKDKKVDFYFGEMSYKQGLTSGTILSAIIALLSPLTQWLTSYVISPEYFPNAITRSVELGYFNTTAEAAANFNYANYAIQGAISAFTMGVATTAIIMVFMKKKKETSEDTKA